MPQFGSFFVKTSSHGVASSCVIAKYTPCVKKRPAVVSSSDSKSLSSPSGADLPAESAPSPSPSRRSPDPGVSSPDAPVYFLADAHLGGQHGPADAENEHALGAFILSLRGTAGHLYLLGDIFDFWFEYRVPCERPHAPVLRALADLVAAGTPVTFLGGNHDYWAGSEFESLTGATVHRDPTVVTHFDRSIFIAHGDGLPAGDWGYRILKAVLRSRLAIALFRTLSPSLGSRIAEHVSDISDITEDRVRRAVPPMHDFLISKLDDGLDAAIVGHVHAPWLWEINGRSAIIVGDWMTHRTVTVLDASGFSMLRWTDDMLVHSEPNDP